MEPFILMVAFLFGTIIGSFLNVVIIRLNTGETLLGRSRCFACGFGLSWYELVPIISFVFLRGRCRTCGSHVSWQYPTVEILTGLLVAASAVLFFPELPLGLAALNFGFLVFLGCVAIVLAVYDFKHMILPDGFVFFFDALALLSLLPVLSGRLVGDGSFLAGLTFFVFFGSLWFVSGGRWMGLGDAKLSLGIGWFLGWSAGFIALLFAFSLGALLGLILIALDRLGALFLPARYGTMKSKVPFGPFLLFGTFLVIFFNIDFMTLTSFFINYDTSLLWRL